MIFTKNIHDHDVKDHGYSDFEQLKMLRESLELENEVKKIKQKEAHEKMLESLGKNTVRDREFQQQRTIKYLNDTHENIRESIITDFLFESYFDSLNLDVDFKDEISPILKEAFITGLNGIGGIKLLESKVKENDFVKRLLESADDISSFIMSRRKDIISENIKNDESVLNENIFSNIKKHMAAQKEFRDFAISGLEDARKKMNEEGDFTQFKSKILSFIKKCANVKTLKLLKEDIQLIKVPVGLPYEKHESEYKNLQEWVDSTFIPAIDSRIQLLEKKSVSESMYTSDQDGIMSLSEAEKDKIESQKDDLNMEELSTIVKEKVLEVIKAETEAADKESQELQELKDQLENVVSNEKELQEQLMERARVRNIIQEDSLFKCLMIHAHNKFKQVSETINMDNVLAEAVAHYTLLEFFNTLNIKKYSPREMSDLKDDLKKINEGLSDSIVRMRDKIKKINPIKMSNEVVTEEYLENEFNRIRVKLIDAMSRNKYFKYMKDINNIFKKNHTFNGFGNDIYKDGEYMYIDVYAFGCDSTELAKSAKEGYVVFENEIFDKLKNSFKSNYFELYMERFDTADHDQLVENSAIIGVRAKIRYKDDLKKINEGGL